MTDNNVVIPANGHNPGVVVTGSGHDYHRGLEGKDAAFLSQLNTSDSMRDITANVIGSSKDNAVFIERAARENQFATLENRNAFTLQIKDLALRTSDQTLAMADKLSKIEASVSLEGRATRDMLASQNAVRSAVELADSKNEIAALKAKLGIV